MLEHLSISSKLSKVCRKKWRPQMQQSFDCNLRGIAGLQLDAVKFAKSALYSAATNPMNAPDRYERFVVPEDEKKIKYEKDSRVVNAGTFTVQREDHTLGNLVRMKLLEDSDVTFAGYKIPHPLEYRMIYKVQTKNSSHDPVKAMLQALTELSEETSAIKNEFETEEQRILQERQQQQ